MQQSSTKSVQCAVLLSYCAAFMPPENLAEDLIGLYTNLETTKVSPLPELMEVLIEAMGKLASASGSLECLKELLTKLYTRRYAQTFSNAGLLITLHQLEVNPALTTLK